MGREGLHQWDFFVILTMQLRRNCNNNLPYAEIPDIAEWDFRIKMLRIAAFSEAERLMQQS